MFYRYLSIGHIMYFFLNIQKIITDTSGFICPKDGRWPHPADCEKFYTCNAGMGVEAWCGNGMTYDSQHQRCDLSRNIDCNNGERPKRILYSELQTEIVTEPIIISTTPSLSQNGIDANKDDKTTIGLTTPLSNKLVYGRMLSPIYGLIEHSPCLFQGNKPDQYNCQSYFICKDEVVTRVQCPDKHLFDEYLNSCNDYRKVFCGNRPIDIGSNDPCSGQPNGWYADYGNQCRSYYLCTEQRKARMDECPIGSRWNPHGLRCDDPRYIATPCGYRSNNNNNASLLGHHHHYSTIFMTISFFLLRV
ncbi:unnamed protein product [Rotaria magnacalcarata]|uniref:Chitin-binding type-2 domain-containing protein n=2 Tax=Rotaria magnacalcarata TaxID=392030 RepID=A0A814ZGD7_9BILA|nr:unnamed protein product [Rotaria magnacalcarata]CAF2113035.1 unnamed protein product [Rotaria magnacalcarata]